jgi:RHS repeat-associated protein
MLSWVGITVWLLLVGNPLEAQQQPNLQTGLEPSGSYLGAKIDSVDLSNGNVMLNIPLISYPQRGGKLRYATKLVLNTKMWKVVEKLNVCGSGCDEDYWEPASTDLGVTDIDDQQVTEGMSSWKTVVGTKAYYLTQEWVNTPDGGEHDLGLVSVGTLRSVDGTGFECTHAGTNSFGNYVCGDIIDRSGIIYPEQTYSGTEVLREDSNGNEILVTYNSQGNVTSYTDTLGRTISTAVSTTNYAGCTGPLPVTYAYLWQPPSPGGTSISFKFCYASVALKTDFGLSNINEYTGSTSMLQSVVLPNGRAWTFQYADSDAGDPSGTNFGDLTQITLPTGGTISYSYHTVYEQTQCGTVWTPASRVVTQRVVNANDGTGGHTWTFAISSLSANPITDTVTDPLGNSTVHTFTLLGGCSYYETKVQYYQGSSTSGALLETVSTAYSYTNNYFDDVDGNDTVANVEPTGRTVEWAGGETSEETFTYDTGFTAVDPDKNGNQTSESCTLGDLIEKNVYDYGSGGPGSLLRKTTRSYVALSNTNYLSANLLNLVGSRTLYNGSSSQTAQDTFSYDGYSLESSGITTEHNSTPPDGIYRGNETSACRWLNTNNSNICNQIFHYDTGTVYQNTDPLNHITTFQYSSAYAGAFPSAITDALGHISTYGYDFNTGLLTSVTDPNSQTTRFSYDSMLRLIGATFPDDGQTTVTYDDAIPSQEICKEMNSSGQSVCLMKIMDGVGRVIETELTTDPSGVDYTVITYDAIGQVSSVTNPYRGTSDPTYGVTSYQYDALGRVIQVTNPDNSTIITSYGVPVGPAKEVQDEGNGSSRITRISQTDALGRLDSVCEVSSVTQMGSSGTPGACGQDVAATGFLTTYSYDALDNLTAVSQAGLGARSFQYNSLSELTSATNPESGTVTYSYDADGNVMSRTDARKITTTYSYDALNRLTGKSFSDGTPAVTFNYDQSSAMGVTLTNTIGRLSSESTAAPSPTGSVFSYDPMGRIINNSQCTPQNCGSGIFPFQYTQYDYVGDLLSATNEMGVTDTYGYNAAAQLSSLTTNFVDGSHPGTLFSTATYTPFGRLTSATLGNNAKESFGYDKRLRLDSYAAASGSTTIYSYILTYDLDSDVATAKDSVNGDWSYSYDGLNRIAASSCSAHCPDGQSTQGFSYAYDRYGNRWKQQVTAGSGPEPSMTFSGGNNRIDGYSYDASGNLLSDSVHTYFYDAEGRIVQVDGSAGYCSNGQGTAATACYVYDAQGRRVRKSTASGSVDYLYDLNGNQVAEVAADGVYNRGEIYIGSTHLLTYTAGPDGSTFFIHSDWLDTERARTDVTGALAESCVGLPFGDELGCSGTDVSPMHFTGKQRDVETASVSGGTNGLDYFGTRYYSSALGRFMTPDPLGGHLVSPQSLDKYVYSEDNPITVQDPTGLDIWLKGCHGNSSRCRGGFVGNLDRNGVFHRVHLHGPLKHARLGRHGIHVKYNGHNYLGVWDTKKDQNRPALVATSFGGFEAIVSGNCLGTCLASGTLYIQGESGPSFRISRQVFTALNGAGGWTKNPFWEALGFDFFHPGKVNFHGYSPAEPEGLPSTHIPVSKVPGAEVRWHVDQHYPYEDLFGFGQHFGSAVHSMFVRLLRGR